MPQKREPCAGKGGKGLQGVAAPVLRFAENESDFCYERIECLCGSSGKPHGRGESGDSMRWFKRSVLWNGPAVGVCPLF